MRGNFTTDRHGELNPNYKDGNSDMEDSICYVDDYSGIIKSLKKAIKDLEFRSYRYFKK